MIKAVDSFLRNFHFYVGRFERRLARPPQELFGNASIENDFMYRFNDALEVSKVFPRKGSELFRSLLAAEQNLEFSPDWITQRIARVYFNLGLNAESEQDKLKCWQECLRRMPNHYRCRELYQQLSQQGSK